MRDADAISHVKTGEMNADVLIANVIRKMKNESAISPCLVR